MYSTLYTPDGPWRDYSIKGPTEPTLQLGWWLHSATPCLTVVQHSGIAILLTRVDAAHDRLIRRLKQPDVTLKYLYYVDGLGEHPMVQRLTASLYRFPPYHGKTSAWSSNLQPIPTGGWSFLVDTPHALLARLFAPLVPTYVYRAQNTCLTYLHASATEVNLRLRSVPYPIAVPHCRGLPYENTCELSPIQRKVELPLYPPPR
ncbi:MAG TPA: hypothetical protein VF808_11865 [Ktedonobacterales bacterium]